MVRLRARRRLRIAREPTRLRRSPTPDCRLIERSGRRGEGPGGTGLQLASRHRASVEHAKRDPAERLDHDARLEEGARTIAWLELPTATTLTSQAKHARARL